MEYNITSAYPTDAPEIATAIMMAVGDEIVEDIAGGTERVPLVHNMFLQLAERTDSQYSYKNVLIARTEDGKTAGVIVCYDGVKLHKLREAFFEVSENVLGTDFRTRMTDETDSSEIYLDTIAVFKEYRGQGVATKLIEAACRLHSESGKKAGLLVEPDNERAYRLYLSLGFEFIGKRPFAGAEMDHLQRDL